MRIALIHALKHSIVPIEASFGRLWPDASLMNLLDDSLSADVAREGRLTAGMTDRFLSLGHYAASTGADAILFTCSAFGPCIEAVAREQAPMPVLKPNEAMIEQAAARGHRIGLLSTFPPTLASMSCRNWRKARWPHWIAAIAPNMIAWSRKRHAICAIATSSRWRSTAWRRRRNWSRRRRGGRCSRRPTAPC